MKVKELIKLLEEQPQDHDVVMASDSEGNSYNYFDGFNIGYFNKEHKEFWWQDDWEESNPGDAYPNDNCIVFYP